MSGNCDCDCGGPQLTRAAEQKAVSEDAAARSIIKIRGTGVGSDVRPMCQLRFLCLGTRPHLRRRILFFYGTLIFCCFIGGTGFSGRTAFAGSRTASFAKVVFSAVQLILAC